MGLKVNGQNTIHSSQLSEGFLKEEQLSDQMLTSHLPPQSFNEGNLLNFPKMFLETQPRLLTQKEPSLVAGVGGWPWLPQLRHPQGPDAEAGPGDLDPGPRGFSQVA